MKLHSQYPRIGAIYLDSEDGNLRYRITDQGIIIWNMQNDKVIHNYYWKDLTIMSKALRKINRGKKHE
jgi:hypothetical protein